MNAIKAVISKIQTVDNINIVSFTVGSITMKMMSLELSSSVKVGTEVLLGTKSTNIALAKSLNSELSISNQLTCSITDLEIGELLCVVHLDFFGQALESIITIDSALRLKLQINDEIIALIKSSELSIVEVI